MTEALSFLYLWLFCTGSISFGAMAAHEYPSGSKKWRIFYLAMAATLLTFAIKYI